MRTLNVDRRGTTAVVTALVIAMVFCAVMIPVGLVLWQGVTLNIDQTGWPSAANTTLQTLNTNIGTGFSLLAIVPIVIVAGGIISVLLYYFRSGGQ